MYQNMPNQPLNRTATTGGNDGLSSGSLVVGPGIVLNGEIGCCERLEVQGSLNADLSDTRDLVVKAGGKYKGTAKVQSATVAGLLEGDLIVEGLLEIESTGRVSGRIQFGELSIARGGSLCGNVSIAGNLLSR